MTILPFAIHSVATFHHRSLHRHGCGYRERVALVTIVVKQLDRYRFRERTAGKEYLLGSIPFGCVVPPRGFAGHTEFEGTLKSCEQGINQLDWGNSSKSPINYLAYTKVSEMYCRNLSSEDSPAKDFRRFWIWI